MGTAYTDSMRPLLRTVLLGIDGCRGGWVIARWDPPRRRPTIELVASFRPVVEAVRRGALACVDMPIGLSDGPRACDAAARRLLGSPRSSSVFTPPCRAALQATTATERRRINLRRTGRSLSEQALGIADRIRDVDRLVTPRLQLRLRECHPEVAFATLSGRGTGLRSRKKSSAGRRERLRLLPPPFREAFAAFLAGGPAEPAPPGVRAAPDDVLDALACLAAAHRVARGRAIVLPHGRVERDARGLRMEIVA